MELIDEYYNNLLASHFKIDKTCELVARKYYWPIFHYDVKVYIKDCDICLALKAVCHKLYRDLQSSLILTHGGKNLLIDFVTDFPVSTNWKSRTYSLILVIVNWLIKIVYHKLVKVIINVSELTEVIINVTIQHHDFLDSIITNQKSVFTLKFWFSLCYFFGIKRRLSNIFIRRVIAKLRIKTV